MISKVLLFIGLGSAAATVGLALITIAEYGVVSTETTQIPDGKIIAFAVLLVIAAVSLTLSEYLPKNEQQKKFRRERQAARVN